MGQELRIVLVRQEGPKNEGRFVHHYLTDQRCGADIKESCLTQEKLGTELQ